MSDERIQFSDGRRYVRAFVEHGDGVREAIAFYDKRWGVWLNAASWRGPSRRLYAGRDLVGPAREAGVVASVS